MAAPQQSWSAPGSAYGTGGYGAAPSDPAAHGVAAETAGSYPGAADATALQAVDYPPVNGAYPAAPQSAAHPAYSHATEGAGDSTYGIAPQNAGYTPPGDPAHGIAPQNAVHPTYGAAPRNAGHPVAGGFPAVPYGTRPPPYVVGSSFPHAQAKPVGNGFSIAAFVLAAIAVLILPVVFGLLAITFGGVAQRRGEPRGRLALVLGIAGTVVGFAFGVIARLF